MKSAASERRGTLLLVLAKQLFPVFNEADGDHQGRPRKAGEEHHFQQSHGKDGKSHRHDCSLFFGLWSSDLRQGIRMKVRSREQEVSRHGSLRFTGFMRIP